MVGKGWHEKLGLAICDIEVYRTEGVATGVCIVV